MRQAFGIFFHSDRLDVAGLVRVPQARAMWKLTWKSTERLPRDFHGRCSGPIGLER